MDARAFAMKQIGSLGLQEWQSSGVYAGVGWDEYSINDRKCVTICFISLTIKSAGVS